MAISEIKELLKIVPAVRNSPGQFLWSSYEAEADLLYINFKKPIRASESESQTTISSLKRITWA